MSSREKLKGEVQATTGAELLPHQRRGALILALPDLDLLDAAVAIADDDSAKVAAWLEAGKLYRPTLGDLADLCANPEILLQFVILQPYVLAQVLESTVGKPPVTQN